MSAQARDECTGEVLGLVDTDGDAVDAPFFKDLVRQSEQEGGAI